MEPVMTLKYGCNPQQKPSVIYSTVGAKMPFKVINGTPGCVALHNYQLSIIYSFRKSFD